MKWRSGRRSQHVEDRRGRRVSGGLKIGGGLGGLLLILIVLLMGGDPSLLLTGDDGGVPAGTEYQSPPSDEAADFISVVLASTEDVWTETFQRAGSRYAPPSLVLFDDYVRSACGFNSAATGPFYCPADRKVYLDLGFFRELARLGGPGDFAQAYVVGHEVGHHVQNLVGTADQGRRMQGSTSRADANRLSVQRELQADCYAGVWAHHASRRASILEPGDVEEGLQAAAAIGDDRLQRTSGRAVHPESFTHGTSVQRQDWLRTGLETGSLEAYDTFARAGL